MKIALICDWFPPRVGGVERQVWELAEALAARGHDTHVYTTDPGDAAPAGVAVHRLRMRRFVNVAIPLPQYFSIGHDILSRGRFDVVHAHAMFSGMGLGMAWLAAGVGTPSVLTTHSLIEGPTRAGGKLLGSIFLRRLTAVSAVSQRAAEDIHATLGRRDAIVIPNGIHVRDWAIRDHGLRVPRQMAAVTRLASKRNPLGLVRAAARIFATAPGDAHLTIIGSGPEQARLEKEAGALGISGRVTIRASAEPGEIRALLARSSVFLSACRAEAFGLAALEARAMGVPVVALAGGGIGDVVEHGRTGLLAQDEDELAAHALTLIGEPAAGERMSAASQRGLEQFDWSTVAQSYVALYRDAIARRGPERAAPQGQSRGQVRLAS